MAWIIIKNPEKYIQGSKNTFHKGKKPIHGNSYFPIQFLDSLVS